MLLLEMLGALQLSRFPGLSLLGSGTCSSQRRGSGLSLVAVAAGRPATSRLPGWGWASLLPADHWISLPSLITWGRIGPRSWSGCATHTHRDTAHSPRTPHTPSALHPGALHSSKRDPLG